MQKQFILLALLAVSAEALYAADTKVVQLTADSFNQDVLESDEVWIVEFYAPWCGHCKTLAPEFEKAARALKGLAKVGAVDMTVHQSVGAPYNIQGFPTLKFFGADKKKPSDYNGERSAKAIVDGVIGEVKKAATSRLGGSSGSSGSGSQGSQGGQGSQCGGGAQGGQGGHGGCGHNHGGQGGHNHGSQGGQDDHAGSADVTDLTGDNFDDLVVNAEGKGWLVMFYAPWCGHCKVAIPELNEAGALLKKEKNVKIGRINCDEHKDKCGTFGIRGYPTIKWFANGSNEDYQGGRDKASFVSFIEGKKEFVSPPKPLEEMVSQEVFNEACIDNDGGLCLIAFLPSIRDSGEEKRNEYINDLENLKAKHKGKPLSFLWSEGGKNFDFEDSFGLGFGFPALLAIHNGKKKYAVMRTHYNPANMDKFLSDLMIGRVQIQTFYNIPKIKTKKPVTSEDL